MPIDYTGGNIKKMVEAIDQDHETVEDAAKAALGAAEEILKKRAAYVIVGQLYATKERQNIPPGDPEAIKVALGLYSTEAKAVGAAESLWHNRGSGDSFRCWVLPLFWGTPGDLHGERKEKYKEIEKARKHKVDEQMKESIRKHREAMEERARGGKGSCKHCAHQSYEHMLSGNGRGKCSLFNCKCERWKEKTK